MDGCFHLFEQRGKQLSSYPRKTYFYNFSVYLLGSSAWRSPLSTWPQSLFCAHSIKSVIDLPFLLGSLQYFSRFIRDFSGKAASLFDLCNKRMFYQTMEHEHAPQNVLNYLSASAVLHAFPLKYNKPMFQQDVYPEPCISWQSSGSRVRPNTTWGSRECFKILSSQLSTSAASVRHLDSSSIWTPLITLVNAIASVWLLRSNNLHRTPQAKTRWLITPA